MKTNYYVLLLLLLAACKSPLPDYNTEIETLSDFSQLQAIIDSDPAKTWVVNFWATTCPPCLKEMPQLAEIAEQNPDVKVLLVSLDLPRDHDKRVIPFVEKHRITPEVVHLTDENYSKWTDQIDSSWYGALPATKIINGKKSNFKFGMYEQLSDIQKDIESVSH